MVHNLLSVYGSSVLGGIYVIVIARGQGFICRSKRPEDKGGLRCHKSLA